MFNKKSGQSLSSFVLTVDSIHLGPAVVRITVPDMDASKVIGPEPFSCKNLVCGLAILLQIARREFACCTSIGECSTTHKGVTAQSLDRLSSVRLPEYSPGK